MIVIRVPEYFEERLRESLAKSDVAEATRMLQDAAPAMIETLLAEATNPAVMDSLLEELTLEEMDTLLDEFAANTAADMGGNVPNFRGETCLVR